MEESVEDMTAALMAPRPKKATAGGVKYCRHKGRTSFVLSPVGVMPKSVLFQSVALAMAPNITEGPIMIKAKKNGQKVSRQDDCSSWLYVAN